MANESRIEALRQAVALNPEDDQAWNQLCTSLRRQGRVMEGEACAREATRLRAACGLHWLNLGNCLGDQQRWAEAAEAYRQATTLQAAEPLAYSNLSVALLQQGKTAEAEAYARRAVEMDASSAAFLANLGACLFEQRRWAEAARAFEDAARLAPASGAVWGNLAAAKQRLGLVNEAQAAFERSLALTPENIDTKANYASLVAQRGEVQAALTMLQGILSEHPQCVRAWLAAGGAWHLADDMTQAIAAARRAYDLAPGQFEVQFSLAQLLVENGELDEAEQHVRKILAAYGASAEAWGLLGTIFVRQGRQRESVEAYRRSLEIEPSAHFHSLLLLSLQYSEDSESLLQFHREWDERYGGSAPTPIRDRAGVREGDGRLRIGFVSADLRLHPVGFLALSAVESLDRRRCSVVCYYDGLKEDRFTSRFRSAADLWRMTRCFSTDEMDRQIREDEIDILIDLMGHTGTRLPVFVRRPAPMQVSWLGYVGTTGVSAMDFLLADRFHVREGEERWYAERVLRMPNGYACYGPPDYAPDVAPLPALSAKNFIYGCFNNPAKYSPQILDAWAQILHGQPTARLLLKYYGLDQKNVARRLRGLFEQRGIDGGRVLLERSSPNEEMLAAYSRVDLALDTQPYSGGLTTCEALWMGVPLVTFPGKSFAGRHATSHLTNAGFQQFVAADVAEYVGQAISWADRIDELAELRLAMRGQVRQSPLCDAPRFAEDFVAVLHEAWERRTAARA